MSLMGSPQWGYSAGADFTIDQSLRFEDGSSPYLKRDFTTPTNAKKWTLSFWMKQGNIGVNKYILSYDSGGNV